MQDEDQSLDQDEPMTQPDKTKVIEEEVKKNLVEAERNKQLNAQLQKDHDFHSELHDKLNQTHNAQTEEERSKYKYIKESPP